MKSPEVVAKERVGLARYCVCGHLDYDHYVGALGCEKCGCARFNLKSEPVGQDEPCIRRCPPPGCIFGEDAECLPRSAVILWRVHFLTLFDSYRAVKWQIGQIVNLNFKATDCEAGAAGEILPANSTAIGDPIFVKRPSRSRKWNQGALATLAQILTEAGAVPVIDGVRIEPKRNPPPVAIAGSKMNGAMANFLSATIPTHPDSVNIAKDAFLSSTPVGEPIEVKWPLCPKTGFNEQDGETYRCSLAKGHKFNCKPGERVSA